MDCAPFSIPLNIIYSEYFSRYEIVSQEIQTNDDYTTAVNFIEEHLKGKLHLVFHLSCSLQDILSEKGIAVLLIEYTNLQLDLIIIIFR